MWGARGDGRLSAEVLTAVKLAAMLLPVVLYDKATPFPGLAALPPCLGAAAIIWVGRHRQTAAARLLSVPVVVGIRLISHSLYLWHWPLIVQATWSRPGGRCRAR